MRGNIGEWSELYTMFKLLADGKLPMPTQIKYPIFIMTF